MPDHNPPPIEISAARLPLAKRAHWRQRIGRMALLALAAHLCLIGLLLWLGRPANPVDEESGGQQISMVFEPSRTTQTQGLPDAPRPGMAPSPIAPPEDNAPPTPPSPATPPPPAEAEQTPTPPQPVAPPEASEKPPSVNLFPSQEPDAPSASPLAPVPIPQAPPAPPAPPSPRPAPRVARRNQFPTPSNYALVPDGSVPRAPNTLDLNVGSGSLRNTGKSMEMASVREGDPGPDFFKSLNEWWFRHRFYPELAAMHGDEGEMHLVMIVDRSGRVISLRKTDSSGSTWLDAAGISTWRNAQLAPVAASLGRDQITVDLTLHYILRR